MESLRTKVVFFLVYLRPGPFQGAGRGLGWVCQGSDKLRLAEGGLWARESGGRDKQEGVGGARQVRQASAGCGWARGSGGEGPVRQGRQVRQACCGAEGFCLNVSLVSLVSGGPLKVRGAEPSLSHLSRASFLEGPGGGHPPARRLVSMSQGGPLGFGGRGDCQPAEGVSDVSGLWGPRGAGRLPARRGCLRCLACLAGGSSGVRGAASDSPPSFSHLSRGASSGLRRACLSCLTCLRGVRPLGRGLARGFTQKCRQFFSRFFHVLLA